MRWLLLFVASVQMYAATGKIVLLGSIIDSGNIYLTNTSAKMYDGDFTTSWGTSVTGQWSGIDAGAAVTLYQYQIATRVDAGDCVAGHSCWSRGNGQNVIEASNSATFSSGVVTLDTLTNQPFVYQLSLQTRSVSPGATYRYYRLRSPAGYGDAAELVWIANAQGGVNAQPVAPVISPWGGAYPSGSVTVTLSSLTTSASLYYTTDGTTPTCSSTAYSAPFVLSPGSSTTLKSVACDATLSTNASTVSTSSFHNYGWASGTVQPDIATGITAQTYSGGISFIGGVYYQTGQWMAGDCNMWSSSPAPCSDVGVWLYSSTDLYNWTLIGQILDDGTSGGHSYAAVTRTHIIYNKSTGKYVLWAHCLDSGSTQGTGCNATASAISGPWTWNNVAINPDGLGYKDCNLFVDTDGTGYTTYTDGTQTNIMVSRLSADYLTTTGSYVTAVSGGGYESPILFKRNSTYYLIYGPSTLYGRATIPLYSTASTPLGTWTYQAGLFSGTPAAGFQAQPTAILRVPHRSDAWMYVGDLWSMTIQNSTRLYVPVTFSGTAMTAQTPASWDLSYWNLLPVFPMPGPVGSIQ